MFNPEISLEAINAFSADTLLSTLGIEFVEIGPDFMRARMPVDGRTVQPFHRHTADSIFPTQWLSHTATWRGVYLPVIAPRLRSPTYSSIP